MWKGKRLNSQMLIEAREAPEVVERLLQADLGTLASLAESWRAAPPSAVVTIARGSSDHASSYFAYLVMTRLGRVVSSLPMSVITLHEARLHAQGLMAVGFSQSGMSPDLIAPMQYFRHAGARTVSIVNNADSPLAHAAEWRLPLHAGPETSVAATKSFIGQLVGGARVVAEIEGDKAGGLKAALTTLPDALRRGLDQDWSVAVDVLKDVNRLFVIGRGTSQGIASEAALKLKETCGIQAEAFSSAEVKHGPMAVVEDGFPMIVFAPRGPAQAGLLALADDMRSRGARVLLAAPEGTPGAELPLAVADHEDLDPIVAIQSFYQMVESLSLARGRNPDKPMHLSKVTLTQ